MLLAMQPLQANATVKTKHCLPGKIGEADTIVTWHEVDVDVPF